MATGLSLVLRQIAERPRPSAHKPNEWRRYSKAQARTAGIPRRRWLRAERRRQRAGL